MKIYIPYYENCSWHTAILNSLECNLYKRKGGGYTILLIITQSHLMVIMFTVKNQVHLHISVKTMEMPMCTSWMLKQLNGKTERITKHG